MLPASLRYASRTVPPACCVQLTRPPPFRPLPPEGDGDGLEGLGGGGLGSGDSEAALGEGLGGLEGGSGLGEGEGLRAKASMTALVPVAPLPLSVLSSKNGWSFALPPLQPSTVSACRPSWLLSDGVPVQ